MTWTTSYHHYDGQGSTVALTDENEIVTDTYRYTAYGETKSSTGSTENPFRYNGETGYYFDDGSEDYYVRARTYEPRAACWISQDPLRYRLLELGIRKLRLSDGMNVYSYVLNSPTAALDPSGLFRWMLWGDTRAGDTADEATAKDATCEDREKTCINDAVAHIKAIIAKKQEANKSCINPEPDTTGRLGPRLKRYNARCKNCRSQIEKCILDTLKSKIKIGCGEVGDSWSRCRVSRSPDKSAYTTGACSVMKAVGHQSNRALLAEITRNDNSRTEPCVACPSAYLEKSEIVLCRGTSHVNPLGLGADCRPRKLVESIVHEVLHNCVGREHTSKMEAVKVGREGLVQYLKEFMTNCSPS